MRRSDGGDVIVVATSRWREIHSLEGGHMLWYILFAIVWIAIAFWPARVAARKGHSFFLYFLFSLVFFPLALLVAYMISDRRVAVATY